MVDRKVARTLAEVSRLRGLDATRPVPGVQLTRTDLVNAVKEKALREYPPDALDREGIAASAEPVDDLDTGICVVMVEPSAERTFVTTLGAERRISVASLGTSEPGPGDLVCVTGFSLALQSTRDPLLAVPAPHRPVAPHRPPDAAP